MATLDDVIAETGANYALTQLPDGQRRCTLLLPDGDQVTGTAETTAQAVVHAGAKARLLLSYAPEAS